MTSTHTFPSMQPISQPLPQGLPECLTIYFDGACEPRNPGGWATYGWAITCTASSRELATGHGVAAVEGSPLSTNNYAEYSALEFALRWLADRNWTGVLQIYGDSKLVVEQVARRWNCNKQHLQVLRQRVWDLLKKLGDQYELTWIPRDNNERCDALARQAYTEATGKPFPKR